MPMLFLWIKIKPRLWVQLLYFKYQPRFSHRSPPCEFLSDCNLQNAIDFAAHAKRSGVVELEAWQALHLTLTNCGTASLYTPNPNPK
nr:hypothetical protein GZ9C4_40 [uncultured archaeon GZfos9C4]